MGTIWDKGSCQGWNGVRAPHTLAKSHYDDARVIRQKECCS